MINDLKSINHFFHLSQTKNGVHFDPNEDNWKVLDSNKCVYFYFNRLKLKKKYLYSLKKIIKWYLENYSIHF